MEYGGCAEGSHGHSNRPYCTHIWMFQCCSKYASHAHRQQFNLSYLACHGNNFCIWTWFPSQSCVQRLFDIKDSIGYNITPKLVNPLTLASFFCSFCVEIRNGHQCHNRQFFEHFNNSVSIGRPINLTALVLLQKRGRSTFPCG